MRTSPATRLILILLGFGIGLPLSGCGARSEKEAPAPPPAASKSLTAEAPLFRPDSPKTPDVVADKSAVARPLGSQEMEKQPSLEMPKVEPPMRAPGNPLAKTTETPKPGRLQEPEGVVEISDDGASLRFPATSLNPSADPSTAAANPAPPEKQPDDSASAPTRRSSLRTSLNGPRDQDLAVHREVAPGQSRHLPEPAQKAGEATATDPGEEKTEAGEILPLPLAIAPERRAFSSAPSRQPLVSAGNDEKGSSEAAKGLERLVVQADGTTMRLPRPAGEMTVNNRETKDRASAAAPSAPATAVSSSPPIGPTLELPSPDLDPLRVPRAPSLTQTLGTAASDGKKDPMNPAANGTSDAATPLPKSPESPGPRLGASDLAAAVAAASKAAAASGPPPTAAKSSTKPGAMSLPKPVLPNPNRLEPPSTIGHSLPLDVPKKTSPALAAPPESPQAGRSKVIPMAAPANPVRAMGTETVKTPTAAAPPAVELPSAPPRMSVEAGPSRTPGSPPTLAEAIARAKTPSPPPVMPPDSQPRENARPASSAGDPPAGGAPPPLEPPGEVIAASPEVNPAVTGQTDDYKMVTVFYATDRQALEASVAHRGWSFTDWAYLAVMAGGVGLVLGAIVFCQPRNRLLAVLAVLVLLAAAGLGVVAYRAGGAAQPDIQIQRTYGNQRGELEMGTCQVSIPRSHERGELERPSIFRFQLQEDAAQHVVLLNVTQQPEEDFFRALATRVAASKKKEALVFVHGFNVTFEAAARRTAQLAYDLKFDGAPIFFSWPSQGGLLQYTVDETNVAWSAPHLKDFLLAVAEHSGASAVNLVAHSMGNRALTAALQTLAYEIKGQAPLFREVVLTAPDIDADVFRRDLAPAVVKMANRVTLYASSNDEALRISKQIHGYPRAGDSGPNLIVVPGVDTIDVSSVDTSLLGHSYYGSNDSVLADLFDLLVESKPARERHRLRSVAIGQLSYWVFAAAAGKAVSSAAQELLR